MGLPPLPRSSAPQTEIQVALIPPLRKGIERDYFHTSRVVSTQKTAVRGVGYPNEKAAFWRVSASTIIFLHSTGFALFAVTHFKPTLAKGIVA